jgi:dipeptidyl-peptidase-4
MTDTFPRQNARTRGFTLGVPRSFQISPDGSRVVFLRSKGGSDPVTCLWQLDVATGREHLVADPARLGADGDLDEAEKARRERSREQAAGIVAFGCDADVRLAVFGLSGRVYAADLTGAGPDGGPDGGPGAGPAGGPAGGPDGGPGADRSGGRAGVRVVPVLAPAADPRPDPAGRLVAYASGGALRVTDLAAGEDRVIAAPDEAGDISFGLAEFIAAEEMRRSRGYWWAPDSSALLVARVDESAVTRWHIADPSSPAQPAAEVRYPAAGTPNADVSLLLAGLDGRRTPVGWDSAAFPYLVTAYWAGSGSAGEPPLIVVQARDQRETRILAVDPRTGATTVVRADTDPDWLDIIPGVPARTASGRIVWTADTAGTHRLIVAAADELRGGGAVPVTPDGLQVREVLSVDGESVLFAASDADPTEIGLWTHGPAGLARLDIGDSGPGVHTGVRAGGTTVAVSRSLSHDGAIIRVLRGDEVARITSLADTPLVPARRPVIFAAGKRGIRTALLLPSWHEPGTGRLPVLMDPYGGPHGQRVTASRDAFRTSQWLADRGFAVVVADGRGTPGRGPGWEKAVAGDLAGPPLEDQVEALHAAAARSGDMDLDRVAIRGWSFGGYLSALAVLRRPDVFHAAIAGAPVTEWRLYDTHYTERYLGHPDENPGGYDACSLLADAHRLSRPLLIIHGLADDNVVVAHSLRLSSALLRAGRPHSVLPLSGVTHMAGQEEVAENLLLLQVDFLRTSLGAHPPAHVPGV